MKVAVIGTRGFPEVLGGVETHCQYLYPLLAEKGVDITVFTRRSYIKSQERTIWKKVNFKHLWCPKAKSFEAIIHTTFALLYARSMKVDIVHIHAIGPALLVPFAKLLRFKVVVTHHGPDYERDKWNCIAKTILKFGEKIGCRFADEVISISKGIGDIVKRRVGRDTKLIYNGVDIPERTDSKDYIESLGLASGKYILAVARFVPEKGLHNLMSSFSKLSTDWTLVIAGDADHETSYSRQLKCQAAINNRIVLTGFIKGQDLHEIYSHAGLFVLPSYHEGLPISLLEALSYGLSVLVSDITPNKEVDVDEERYFSVGNEEALTQKLCHWIKNGPLSEEDKAEQIEMIGQKYNWNTIAEQVSRVYNEILFDH